MEPSGRNDALYLSGDVARACLWDRCLAGGRERAHHAGALRSRGRCLGRGPKSSPPRSCTTRTRATSSSLPELMQEARTTIPLEMCV